MFNVTLLILTIWLTPWLIAGNIKWTLQEHPAIFGTNIHLICHLPIDTCCNDHRKWNAGNQYILIIINGLSQNSTRYKEELIEKERVSVLTILSFSEEDINIPYECVYGFQKYRSVLALTEDAFEFHPTETIPVTPTVRDHNISFAIQFTKVFPIPLCQAKLGMQNLSSFLFVSVERNNLFYESSLKFKYSSSETACTDSLKVVCRVGKTVLTVVDYTACPFSGGKDILPTEIVVVLVVVSAATILVAVVICIYLKRRANGRQQEQTQDDQELEHIDPQSDTE